MLTPSLHRIAEPFQGRCPPPAASVLPLPLAGAGRKAGQTLVPLFSSTFLSPAETARRAVPSGNAACPACCCSALGSDTPECHTQPPLGHGGQGPHLPLPFSQTLSSFAKINTCAYSLLEQMSPVILGLPKLCFKLSYIYSTQWSSITLYQTTR